MNKIEADRVLFLDVLRGIAALSVVLFHYSRDLATGLFRPPFNYGYMGVHLFFIISGFVIFMTLEKTTTSKQFIINRFSRLFPGYWFNVCLTFLVILLLGNEVEKRSVVDLIVNLTMLQHWFLVSPIDGVYWTLTIELCFYFFMLVIFASKQMHNIYLWSLLLVFIMIIAKYVNLYYNLPLYFVLPLLHYNNLFFAGILFYKIFSKRETIIEYLLLLLTLITQFILNENIVENIIVVVFYISFLSIVKLKINWSNFRVLISLGSISYSLYLMHQINSRLLYNKLLFINKALIIVIIVFSCMIAGSYFVTFKLERPLQKYLRQILS